MDHKPLLKILGDRKLEDIDNPRLLKLKEKTLNWRFKVVHVPGRIHVGPDTLSRREVMEATVGVFGDVTSNEDSMEATIEAQVASNIPTPMTWQQVREEVSRDKIMTMLSDQITEGFLPDRKLVRLELREYYSIGITSLKLMVCPSTKVVL